MISLLGGLEGEASGELDTTSKGVVETTLTLDRGEVEEVIRQELKARTTQVELLHPSSFRLISQREATQGEVVLLLHEAAGLVGGFAVGDILVLSHITSLLPAVIKHAYVCVVLRVSPFYS